MRNLPRQIYKALGYSLAGIKAALQSEWAFRVEIFCAIIALPVAFYVGNTAVERALLISSVFLILIIELINTAIETAIDRISADHHALSARAKDIGSAAVLLAILNAIVIWLLFVVTNF